MGILPCEPHHVQSSSYAKEESLEKPKPALSVELRCFSHSLLLSIFRVASVSHTNPLCGSRPATATYCFVASDKKCIPQRSSSASQVSPGAIEA